MKYLIIVFIFLISCNNTPFEIDNKEKLTTVELNKIADNDTITYKIVKSSENSNYYAINTKTDLVDYKFVNQSGAVDLLFIILLLMVFILIIFGIIFLE